HQKCLDLIHSLRQQQRRNHWSYGEGGDDRPEQGIGIGARHRTEDLAFHALHVEQRQERAALRNANTSTDPGTSRTCAATSRATRFSPFRSSPNTFTTTSPRAPMIISCTRISMGCANA